VVELCTASEFVPAYSDAPGERDSSCEEVDCSDEVRGSSCVDDVNKLDSRVLSVVVESESSGFEDIVV
jgi:hypothetical protein